MLREKGSGSGSRPKARDGNGTGNRLQRCQAHRETPSIIAPKPPSIIAPMLIEPPPSTGINYVELIARQGHGGNSKGGGDDRKPHQDDNKDHDREE